MAGAEFFIPRISRIGLTQPEAHLPPGEKRMGQAIVSPDQSVGPAKATTPSYAAQHTRANDSTAVRSR